MSKLSREAVIRRALALADAEGVDAVTVRRLAGELDVTPMALYWHFKNKEELLTAVADHLLAGVARPAEFGGPWQTRLRTMVRTLIETMREHPSLPLLFHVAEKERIGSFTRATDIALGLLAEAGFSLEEGYWVSSYLLNGAITLVNGRPDCPGGIRPEEAEERRKQHRLALEALPEQEYPYISAYAETMRAAPDVERYFSFGLDLLMCGVEAMAARIAPASATPNNTA
ncbi:TetR family transcriptional regulator [Thermocatellispora tengchongensis]|nr:TetR family transcriptional regulator [Thermocatellispora tengchongensis]